MILIVGQVPAAQNARDGMVQRIAAVDRVFEDEERVYLTPRPEPFRFPAFELALVRPGVRAASPNTFDRAHLGQTLSLARGARAVIVHSVHWAQHVLPLYSLGHVITDLHGVVPEEQAMLGDSGAAAHLGRVEAFVLRRGAAALVVSDSMAAHYRAKYPDTSPLLITLPVVSSAAVPATLVKGFAPPLRLLYSGGVQGWQNLDRMLEALRRSSIACEVDLLTPEVEVLSRKVAAQGISGRVRVRSVAPEAMAAEYARAHFGFVLRDDHPVNRCACPTKLQEYLAHGVVPIVQSRALGDFERHGYATVPIEDFEGGRLPEEGAWRRLVDQNRAAFAKLDQAATEGRAALRRQAYSLRPPGETPSAEDGASLHAEVLLERLELTRAHLSRYPMDFLLRLARRLGL